MTAKAADTFWIALAKKAKQHAKTAKKHGYQDIAKRELDFAAWCMKMEKEQANG